MRERNLGRMTQRIKRIFLLLLLLALPLSTAAQAAGETTGSNQAGGSNASIQLLFAQLQVELAKQNMAQAQQRIEEIQQEQQEQTEAVQVLEQLRQLQSEDDTQPLPADVVDFLDRHSLSYGTAEEPDYKLAIGNVEDYRSNIVRSVQEDLVRIQDMMGQYAQQGNDLSALGRGSLFAEGGGMGIAALCAAGGLVVGMVLMWGIQRAKAKGPAKP